MNRDRMRELLRSTILMVDEMSGSDEVFWKKMKMLRIGKEEIRSLGLGGLFKEVGDDERCAENGIEM